MAEGGGEFGYKERDPLMDHTDDRDDKEQEDNTPQPFQPVAASTPQHRGETIEMQTMQQEQTGLPETSYEEATSSLAESPDKTEKISTEEIERRQNVLRDKNTGLLNMTKIHLQNILLSEDDKQKEIQRVKKLIKVVYPRAKIDELKIKFYDKKLNQIVVVGPYGGETKIALDDGSGLQQDFLKKSFVKKNWEIVLKLSSAKTLI